MLINVAVFLGTFSFCCTALGDECDATFDSACPNLSLLQVGIKLSSKGDNGAIEATAETATHSGVEPLIVRPGAQSGVKDVVQFGIRLKKWYGVDVAGGTFAVDAVVTLRWNDKRTVKLIPPSASSVTLSNEKAATQMWLPNIGVTNIAHGGDDLISSSVQISKDGQVTQVDRVLLTLQQSFDAAQFPFDSQDASIKLASTTYMKDELQLQPLKAASTWGASADIFNNSVWSLQGVEMVEISENDGTLQKSRGLLTMRVKRSPSEYVSAIFIPTVVLLFMTWSAFWMPFGGPWTMPRVAVNAFALLCQLSLSQSADDMVPACGHAVWMTEYVELCIELQFVLMLVNVLLITIENRPGGQELAKTLNSQLIVAFPLSCTLNIAVLSLGKCDVSRAFVVMTLSGYIGYVTWRFKTAPKRFSTRGSIHFAAPIQFAAQPDADAAQSDSDSDSN